MRNFTFLVMCILYALTLSAQTNILPFGSSWKYMDNGSDQGTMWRSPVFNDAGWKSGNAKFGYGINDAVTSISYGANAKNKYITTYFRSILNITDPGVYSSYTAVIEREDAGVIVYVNGVEVFRNNMPEVVGYKTQADNKGPGVNGKKDLVFTLPLNTFNAGSNVIAVEIHLRKDNSHSMAFDMNVTGNLALVDKTAPVVQSILRQSPATETTTATTVTFRATFSEKVSGVDASDFTVNAVSGSVSGTLASDAVTAVGVEGTTYDITVNSITGSGTLRLDLNSSTGITDDAGNSASGFTNGATYTIEEEPVVTTYGFTSVTPLTAFPITSETKDKPQAKTWKYAGKWWSVLPYASNGVMLLRLDNGTWTNTLTIRATETGRADCWVVGDLVHILLYKGASQNSSLTTVQYDPATGKYKFWPQRPGNVTIVFPPNSETATIVVDTQGRMWAASDGYNSVTQVHEITIRWSDAPYTTWSAPVVIASGVQDDDICAIAAIPNLGKIGVFWSNQNSKKFGFRTHTDGAEPADWLADEMPASELALNAGNGMADDHMNIAVASDGTMYCGVKTGYNTTGNPQVSLLVRRPSGAWDPLYPVTLGNGSGTQPIVVLNEVKGKIKVVYTTVENGGDIVYKESPTSNISFGDQITLISGGGYTYNYATSTHQTYDPEVVILATKYVTTSTSTTWEAVSVLASDDPALFNPITALPISSLVQLGADQSQGAVSSSLSAYPNPFSSTATLSFSLKDAGEYSLSLFDLKGSKVSVIKQGSAEAGQLNTVSVDGSRLSNGVYFVRLVTAKGTQTLKMIYKK